MANTGKEPDAIANASNNNSDPVIVTIYTVNAVSLHGMKRDRGTEMTRLFEINEKRNKISSSNC